MYMLSAVPFFSTSASASRFSTSARVKVPTWISACNTSMMAAFSSSICAQSITAVCITAVTICATCAFRSWICAAPIFTFPISAWVILASSASTP